MEDVVSILDDQDSQSRLINGNEIEHTGPSYFVHFL